MYKTSYSYRTIYDLFTSGKYLLLSEQGITAQFLFDRNLTIESCRTNFKFIKQIGADKTIKIEVSLTVYNNGYLNWYCEIADKTDICVKIQSLNKVNPELIVLLNAKMYPFEGIVNLYEMGCKRKKIFLRYPVEICQPELFWTNVGEYLLVDI